MILRPSFVHLWTNRAKHGFWFQPEVFGASQDRAKNEGLSQRGRERLMFLESRVEGTSLREKNGGSFHSCDFLSQKSSRQSCRFEVGSRFEFLRLLFGSRQAVLFLVQGPLLNYLQTGKRGWDNGQTWQTIYGDWNWSPTISTWSILNILRGERVLATSYIVQCCMVVFPSIPICVCQIYTLKNEPQSQVPKMNLNHSRSQGVQFPLCVEYIVLAAGQIPKLKNNCCMQSYPLHSPPNKTGKSM